MADGSVRRCVNAHPAPRGAFRLGADDALFLARSMDSPNPARILYHSHVAHSHMHRPPELSAADRACAALHPRLAFLVVVVSPAGPPASEPRDVPDSITFRL